MILCGIHFSLINDTNIFIQKIFHTETEAECLLLIVANLYID